jgi:hypothetical protein
MPGAAKNILFPLFKDKIMVSGSDHNLLSPFFVDNGFELPSRQNKSHDV